MTTALLIVGVIVTVVLFTALVTGLWFAVQLSKLHTNNEEVNEWLNSMK